MGTVARVCHEYVKSEQNQQEKREKMKQYKHEKILTLIIF
jgi:hypothetical protein